MKLIGIAVAFIVLTFSTISAHAQPQTQEDYWMYCQESPVVCWIANPDVIMTTPTVVPDPSTIPTTPPAVAPLVPFACPGGGIVGSNGICPPIPSKSGSSITMGDVNLRSGPGTSYSSYGVVPEGTLVTQIDKSQGMWVPVVVNGQTGWISSNYLSRA